jgi:hypothetical protein
MGEDIIRQFLKQVLDILKKDRWYAEHNIPLHIENTGDILYLVETALASCGIALIIKAPRAVAETPAFRITLEVMVLENPSLNRTRANMATALDVAWHAALALRGAAFSLQNIEHDEQEFGFRARATLEAMISVNN